MSLRRIALENYRCFRDRQEFTIFPVTVVLGKNNSGKSALVRAPLVLSTGFGVDTDAPLDLEQLGADAPDGFPDLIFEQIVHRPIRFEVEAEGETPFRLAATLQYVDEQQEAFVYDVHLRTEDVNLRLEWQPDLVASEYPRLYQLDGTLQIRPVRFQGLVPVGSNLPDLGGLSLGPIRYLSSYREALERHHRLPMGRKREVGSRAQHVQAILAQDKARGDGELILLVNEYLRKIAPGWQLDEMAAGPLWETLLTRDSRRVRVGLADAGSGLAQVLPILVQSAIDRLQGGTGSPPLQIIEEPEMHLHPAAHAELADLYLRTAKETGTRFLVETHSETLLLRLRRRIAEGDYSPEDVAVYVVDQKDGVSTVRRVDIDALGNLSDQWPEGYFSQDYHEVRLLAAAQLQRSGDAA